MIDRKMLTAEQKVRVKAVKIRQEGGDDGYQWVIRYDGQLGYSGMTRNEAVWRRDRYILQGAK